MGALRVHGPTFSVAVMRVLTCLHEKQLDYELINVDMRAKQHKKEPFLQLNPFGQVPAFQDGDLLLFESRAITRYISTEYAGSGTQLLQGDSKTMARLGVWSEVEAFQFDPPAFKLILEFIAYPMIGLITDRAVVAENEAKLSKVLDVYEDRLAKSKYIAGDEFTLIDLHHLPIMYYFLRTQTNKLFESRPHVNAWRDNLMARPSWKKVVQMLEQSDEKP